MTDYRSIIFGVDLVEASQAEYDFLLEVQSLDYLRNDIVLQHAIRRYITLWLPLAAAHSDTCYSLRPPIDIAWVWHCHMLAPHKYAKDCHNLFGKLIDHCVVTSVSAYDMTRKLWSQFYHTDPFELSEEIKNGKCPPISSDSLCNISHDLLAAIRRQQDFVYNIHLPHYRDKKFLNSALERYKKYLFLKKKNPSEFLVPCYDIDLVWHTHQLHPVDYGKFTKSLLGRLLIHDDTDSDRNPGSKLNVATDKTRLLWQQEYQEPFNSFGAMYRGDSPKGRLYRLSQLDIENLLGRKALVVVKEISVSSPDRVGDKNVKLKVFKTNLIDRPKRIQKLTGKMTNMIWNNANIELWFDSSDSTLVFELATRSSLFNPVSVIIGGFQERLGLYLRNCSLLDGDSFQFERDMQITSTLSTAKCLVKGSIGPPVLSDIVLLLEPGTYEEANMPTNVEQLWGPVPLPKSDAENICQVASHR